jgi:O-antigen/teichoic acid export membrane protein
VSYVVVARLLGTGGFGEFSAVQSTVGAILVMAGLGLGMTATKYVAERRHKDPAGAARTIILCDSAGLIGGLALSVLLIVFAPMIARSMLAEPRLSGALQISALIVLFSTLVSIQTGALSGFEAFDTIARINIAAAPLGLLFVAVGTYLYGVPGAVFGLGMTQALTWALNRHALQQRAPRIPGLHFVFPTLTEWKTLYTYSGPVLLISLIIAYSNWVAVAALVHQPNGYPQMGIFGAANQWLIALMVLPTIIGQVVFPHATVVIKEGYAASKKLMRHATLVSAAVSVPIIVIGCLLSPFLMRAYGSGFRDSALTLIVVLITAGLLAMQTPAVQVIAAAGRMWPLCVAYVLWGMIFVAGSVAGAKWGAIGLASARLIAYAIHSIVIFWIAGSALRETEPKQQYAIFES